MTNRGIGRMTEAELLRRLGELPKSVEPRQDPWPQIKGRIAATRAPVARTAPGWLQLAAAVAIALGVGIFLGRMVPVASTVDSPTVATTQAAEQVAPMANFGAALAGSEREYQAAFSEFTKIGRSASELKPATLDAIQRDWQEMLDAESALSAALAQYPGNAWLNRRMLELRERQLAMLKQLAGLDRISRRTET